MRHFHCHSQTCWHARVPWQNIWVVQCVLVHSQPRSNTMKLCLLESALINRCPFHNLFHATSSVLCFLLVIWLFNMAPKCSTAEVFSSVPKCKEVVRCLTEKICVRQASCEHEIQCCWLWVHVNESILYILNKMYLNRNTQNKVVYWWTDENIVIRGSWEPNPVFPRGAVVQYLLIHCSWRLYGI